VTLQHTTTMAKSKTLTNTDSKVAKKADAPLITKVANGTPYQLDPAQVERAATALVTHMKQHAQSKEEKAGKKSLLADEDEAADNDEAIWLNVSTKQHVHDTNRLKPSKLFVSPLLPAVLNIF
jgi:ribosome biogenesis protein UTP30